jgi:UDP-N-acetylglucosamine 2-epimerase (hydrolysing)
LAHIHFGSNELAKKRLLQLGEHKDSIFVIGSPDLDVMASPNLPSFEDVRQRYEITHDSYGLFTFHPVTTEIETLKQQAHSVADALLESGMSYIGIYPNNDPGTDIVLDVFREKLFGSEKFKFFPSVRFEYFLTMIKNASFVIGNSSVGIREAPFYGVPSINVGTRQNNRDVHSNITTIHHAKAETKEVLSKIKLALETENKLQINSSEHFGAGNSSQEFVKIINQPDFWNRSLQKQFYDL